jgi:hypothetical protein
MSVIISTIRNTIFTYKIISDIDIRHPVTAVTRFQQREQPMRTTMMAGGK